MISPFICYTISFVCVLLAYSLGWSDLYPKLSAGLLIFLVITFVAHIACHLLLKPVAFKKIDRAKLPPIIVTFFIYILWVVEFIYEGGVGVPLLKILFHLPYNYRLFGIPSLHVFVVTFSSFFTIYLFHLYLSNRSRLLLILYLVNLSGALLIYSRSMLFMNITACIVVYAMSLKKIPYKRIAFIALMMIPMFYVFGVLGSLRVSREAGEPYNNENFMKTGKASKTFRESIVPKEFFWTYIYMSSPLASLQYNIEKNPDAKFSFKSLIWTGVYECVPDFITKRVHRYRGTTPPKEYRIASSFNVGTIYWRSFSYSNWGGIIFLAVCIVAFPWLFLKILDRESDFFVTGWAILCTMYFFMSYDNTLRFTGLSFQLAYPILFSFYEKYFRRTK